jgi:hypothetical protein
MKAKKTPNNYSWKEILKNMKPHQIHGEVDWGKPVGNEILPVDEWGDDGKWETVVDFTKIKKSGVSARQILKNLKKRD